MTPREIAERLSPDMRATVLDPGAATVADFMAMHETISGMLGTPYLTSHDGGKVAEAIAAMDKGEGK